MIAANRVGTKMRQIPGGFNQLMLFTCSIRELLGRGVWSNYTMSRKVRMCYVGNIENLHKYQIGCIETDYILERKADATASLVKKLHSVFRLLVIGADAHGIIQKVYNFPYLQQQWADIKADLLTEYDDTDAEKWNLIQKTDVLLKQYDALLKHLALPEMYGLYFNGYWVDDLPEDSLIMQQLYGEQLDNQSFQEYIQYSIQQAATKQEVVQLSIREHAPSVRYKYHGSCIYVDGVLDACEKTIENDSVIYNYSAKWVGLKKRVQL